MYAYLAIDSGFVYRGFGGKFMRKNTAFTLVELMVTLLIAGILAGIAMVAYSSYISRTRLSEASTMIDALGKAEATYYLTNKRFISFAIPFQDNGKNYASGYGYLVNLPSGGDKYRVNSNDPKGIASQPRSIPEQNGWAALGKPIPDGSMLGFIYGGYAGRRNSSGTVVPITVSGHTNPILFQSNPGDPPQILGFPEDLPSGPSAVCALAYPTSDVSGFGQGADKNWVVIAAGANFNNGADDKSSSGQPLCSYVYKVIETDTNGKIVGGNPIVTVNLGH